MKTLYIECNMGVAGDMLMAALLELLPQPDDFIAEMNALGLPGVRLARETAISCGITGTRVRVTIDGQEEHSHDVPANSPHAPGSHPAHAAPHGGHEASHDHHHGHPHGESGHHTHPPAHHHHNGMEDIRGLIGGLPLPEAVRDGALAVYGRIAEAESKVHNRPVHQIHFHEVGALDAVADIVGSCLLMHQLAPDRVVVSPVRVGSGQIHCSHGILPVPAPATALLLQGAPSYSGDIRGELCTPTGAALVRHFADEFGSQPVMTVEAIGYGMGTKQFEAANCLRVFYGEESAPAQDAVEIVCNLDDMTGEAIGFARELLLRSGALDVYLIPLQMKKDRPGSMLCCLCRPEDADRLATLMLKHTTSFGVRISTYRRLCLERHVDTVETKWGPVRRKRGDGQGVAKEKYEYEDVAAIARQHGLSLAQVYEALSEK